MGVSLLRVWGVKAVGLARLPMAGAPRGTGRASTNERDREEEKAGSEKGELP